MHKNITYILIALILLIVAGIFHYEMTKPVSTPPDNNEALVATTTDTVLPAEIIAAYNQGKVEGIQAGRIEVVTAIRKEIITTGQLNIDIPLGNGTVKNMILIIKQ